MKKGLVILMAIAMVFAMTSLAMAKQEANNDGTTPAKGNIVANEYNIETGNDVTTTAAGTWWEYERGLKKGNGYVGNSISTHKYGTWNSPYTAGVDGYNYNDGQDYVGEGKQVNTNGQALGNANAANAYTSGPHGGYLTSTHRCRECHAVHRAAGKFKLLRSDSRFEACDWCHGTGAGSGFNIQMDNNDVYTEEYNVGHTMGFGIQSGKWKAPDDTYPAFTPNYYMGGFSCFDCHSPHANPARMLGFRNDGSIGGIPEISGATPGTGQTLASVPAWQYTGRYFGIGNAGHENWAGRLKMANNPQGVDKPFWLSGSWLLIKNPDKEIASTGTVIASGILTPGGSMGSFTTSTTNVTITAGQEIPDYVTGGLLEFDSNKGYPVNKMATDWNSPIGNAKTLWIAKHPTNGTEGLVGDFNGTNSAGQVSTGKAYGEAGWTIKRSDLMNNVTGYKEPRAIFNASGQVVGSESALLTQGGQPCEVWSVNEFCTDCHDGNAGKHDVAAPLFSEDRALRAQTTSGDNAGNSVTGDTTNYKGSYDVAYGHDSQPRH